MKRMLLLLAVSGQTMAHSGRGTADELFHLHGAEYIGGGLLVLSLMAVPLAWRVWRHLRS